MDDSVSLPGQGGGPLASPGVEQPRRRLGRLRKAGAVPQQSPAAPRGENAAPNAAQADGDSLVSKEQPLVDQQPPSGAAGDQKRQEEEVELEEEDAAAASGSEAAGGEVRRRAMLS